MKLRSKQFAEFWGCRILVKVKRGKDNYIGQLTREDEYFIFLTNVEATVTKEKIPRLAISKRAIMELRDVGDA